MHYESYKCPLSQHSNTRNTRSFYVLRHTLTTHKRTTHAHVEITQHAHAEIRDQHAHTSTHMHTTHMHTTHMQTTHMYNICCCCWWYSIALPARALSELSFCCRMRHSWDIHGGRVVMAKGARQQPGTIGEQAPLLSQTCSKS